MFSIIVAISKNRVIGKDNSLIWHIPEDLKRFKELTMGKTIVMGRKTFESLPCVLPGREHVVLTQNKQFTFTHDKVKIFNDVNEIISTYKDSEDEIFIIGGGEIYDMFLNHAKKLYVTEVLEEFQGDTYFPKINNEFFNLIFQSPIYTSSTNLKFKFLEYISN